MRFVEPVSDLLFSGSDFLHLSESFIRWFGSAFCPPEADDERFGRDYDDWSRTIKQALYELDEIKGRLGLGDDSLKAIALIIDLPAVRDFDTPESRRQRNDIEWIIVETDPQFRPAITTLLRHGYLKSFLHQTNVPEPIGAAFRQLPLVERLRIYVTNELSSELVRIFERIPEHSGDSVMLSMVRLIDEQLFGALIDGDTQTLWQPQDAVLDPFRAWACFRVAGSAFTAVLAGFSSLRLLGLLAALTKWQRSKENRPGKNDYADFPEVVVQRIAILLAEAKTDHGLIAAIEDALATKIKTVEVTDLGIVLEWLFDAKNHDALLFYQPTDDGDERYWGLVSAFSQVIVDEAALPSVCQWVNERNRAAQFVYKGQTFDTDVLYAAIDAAVEIGEAALPLVWLWLADPRTDFRDDELDCWLGVLFEQVATNELAMTQILTLGMECWGDADLHLIWIDYVVERFVEAFPDDADIETDGVPDFVTRFIARFAVQPRFRRYFEVFRQCEHLLTRRLADVGSGIAPALTLPLLVAATIGDQSARNAVAGMTGPASIFNDSLGSSDMGMDEALLQLPQSDPVLDIPYAYWCYAGVLFPASQFFR